MHNFKFDGKSGYASFEMTNTNSVTHCNKFSQIMTIHENNKGK